MAGLAQSGLYSPSRVQLVFYGEPSSMSPLNRRGAGWTSTSSCGGKERAAQQDVPYRHQAGRRIEIARERRGDTTGDDHGRLSGASR